MGVSSCGSTLISKSPVDAFIPELHFQYYEDTKLFNAFGSAGKYYEIDEEIKLRIRTLDKSDCEVTLMDGDNHLTKECNQSKWVDFTLGPNKYPESTVIGISVSHKKVGIQQGFFYIRSGIKREELLLVYQCPQQSRHGIQYTCIRPATYEFNLVAIIELNEPGKIQLASSDCNGKQLVQQQEFEGEGPIAFKVFTKKIEHCSFRVDVRFNNGIKKSASLDINFYNPVYVPLPKPIIISKEVFVGHNSGYMSVNYGEVKKVNNIFDIKCMEFKDLQIAESWDKIGRYSYLLSED